MTIHLPTDLETSVRAEVASGHFASVNDVIAEAVRFFLQQRKLPAVLPGMGLICALRDDADLLDRKSTGVSSQINRCPNQPANQPVSVLISTRNKN